MRDLYNYVLTKTAAAAWQRALSAGTLGAKDLQRLAPHASPSNIAGIRSHLQTPGVELAGDALARYQHGAEARSKLKVLATPSGMLKNHQGIGPGVKSSIDGGQIGVSPQAGTTLRLMSGRGATKALAQGAMVSGKEIPQSLYSRLAEPGDRSLFASTAAHELAERQGMSAMGHGTLAANPVASHISVAPLLAERIGQRDSGALRTFDQLRATTGKDDPLVRKKLREMGMVANYTPPLGGRTHRSMEAYTAGMPVRDAAMNRYIYGGRITPTKEDAQTAARWGTRYDRVKKYLPEQTTKNIEEIREAYHKVLNRPLAFNKQDPAQVRALTGTYTSV